MGLCWHQKYYLKAFQRQEYDNINIKHEDLVEIINLKL